MVRKINKRINQYKIGRDKMILKEIENLRKLAKTTGNSDFSVTYKLNKREGVFNWYPYAEGFSRPFVDKMIKHFKINPSDLVLDPFGGCGTTSLSCILKNIPSVSIEVNPFMTFILKAKIESLELNPNLLTENLSDLNDKIINQKSINIPFFLSEKEFFNKDNLEQALIIKGAIEKLDVDNKSKEFFLLLLSSILVKISDMIRATDLRYRRTKQQKLNVIGLYNETVNKAIQDLKDINFKKKAKAFFINSDTRILSKETEKFLNKVDFFITSPPYLNGTNYERNTKLEMGFLDLVNSESDLKKLRNEMITAGINSTKIKDKEGYNIQFIKPLVEEVKKKAYDRRIPLMVEGYFNDMNKALKNIYLLMKKGAKGVIVIGDSQFGGVHIETDLILAKLCELNNFKINSIEAVRERRSKNGMKLRESLIFVEK
jgi:hypothetical protein